MLQVLDYQDYRKFMQDYYTMRKRTSAFSWREFAKNVGVSSPIFLKLVCDHKANLSKKTIDRVAGAMGLKEFELLYFRALVYFDQGKTDAIKKAAFAEMQLIAKANKVALSGVDAYRYYENWVNPIVRELAVALPGALPKDIAALSHNEISAVQVRECLAFLTKSGYLEETEKNTYRQTEKIIAGSAASIPLAIRSMNREMARFGAEAIDKFPVYERYFAGVTMGIPVRLYDKVVECMEKCRKEVLDLIDDKDPIEQVFRLNLQLFPLSKKVADSEKGE